jgi:hypothetical protein
VRHCDTGIQTIGISLHELLAITLLRAYRGAALKRLPPFAAT